MSLVALELREVHSEVEEETTEEVEASTEESIEATTEEAEEASSTKDKVRREKNRKVSERSQVG